MFVCRCLLLSAEGRGGTELWNCFSKQMSKRKISCLTTSHPSSARDRDGGGVVTVQSEGPAMGSCVLGLRDNELELSPGQKPISPWGKWGHHVGVSASCYPKNCIYRDSWSWRGEEELVMAGYSGWEALYILLRAAEQMERTAPTPGSVASVPDL